MHRAMVSAELNVAGQLRELGNYHWIESLPSKHTATVRMHHLILNLVKLGALCSVDGLLARTKAAERRLGAVRVRASCEGSGSVYLIFRRLCSSAFLARSTSSLGIVRFTLRTLC